VDSNPVVLERQVRDVAPRQPGRGSSTYRRALLAVAALTVVLGAGLAGYAVVRFNPWAEEGGPRPAERAQSKTTTRERRAREDRPARPATGTVTPTVPTPAPEVSYEPFSSTIAGYQTEVPSSWSFDQETTDDGSDVLYRSTWSGPDGTELLIDATPTAIPAPPPNAGSPSTVMHPLFGSAQEYVFSGGRLPQCAERCVLLQIVDGDGGGYAVLAGGGGLAAARKVARHAALELAPYDV